MCLTSSISKTMTIATKSTFKVLILNIVLILHIYIGSLNYLIALAHSLFVLYTRQLMAAVYID